MRLGSAYVDIKGNRDPLKKDLSLAQSDVKSSTEYMEKQVRRIGTAIAGVGTVATAVLGGTVVYQMGRAISKASDLDETISKANTVFGNHARDVMSWSADSATSIGLSQQAALEYTGTLGNMFNQLGAGTKIAADNSKQMVELSADLASFHNVVGGSAEVLDAMQSAFRGEYDALQRYIPTINAAAVQQQALADTNKRSAKELTDLEKATAAMNIILKDAGVATGDFQRTAGGAANQQRILNAQIDNSLASIGRGLLPAYGNILQHTNDWIQANQTLINQDIPKFLDGISDTLNDFYGIAQSLPEEYKGPQGIGIVGGILFGATGIGKVVFAVSAIDAGLKSLKSTIGDYSLGGLVKSYGEAVEAIDNFWIAITKGNPKAIQAAQDYQTAWEEIAAEMENAAEVHEQVTGQMGTRTQQVASVQRSAITAVQSDYARSFSEINAMDEDRVSAALKRHAYWADYMEEKHQGYVDAAKQIDADYWLSRDQGMEAANERAAQLLDEQRKETERQAARMAAAFTDHLFDPVTGDLEDFGDVWDAAWKGMASVVIEDFATKVYGGVSNVIGDVLSSVSDAVGVADLISDYIPGFKTGAWKVEKDTLAMVHEGEMIVPKQYAEGLRGDTPTTVGGYDYSGARQFTMAEFNRMIEVGGPAAYMADSARRYDPTTGEFMHPDYTPSQSKIATVVANQIAKSYTGLPLGLNKAISGYAGIIVDRLMGGTSPTRGSRDTGSGYGTGGGRGGEYETESDASGGMGGVRHGGWTVGPESGYPVTHHGSEYTLNADQIKAVRELGMGGGNITIHVHFDDPRLKGLIRVESDSVAVNRVRAGVSDKPTRLYV